jgi:hypothetical protein
MAMFTPTLLPAFYFFKIQLVFSEVKSKWNVYMYSYYYHEMSPQVTLEEMLVTHNVQRSFVYPTLPLVRGTSNVDRSVLLNSMYTVNV